MKTAEVHVIALQHKAISRMEWDEFEKTLHTTTRGGVRSASNEQALRQYFGDEEFEELRRLAQRTQAVRSRATLLGNVILIPGIMGSNLMSVANGDEDLVWVNLARIALGRIAGLRLLSDGSGDADENVKVSATVIDKRTYSRAVLKLRAKWDVHPFAFDWRKDIDVASDSLASFIKDNLKDRPVHIVAHSMGGLVARNFIRRHKELWKNMRGDGSQGGRLIMMGTPNYGSFSIPQVLTGSEKLVRWLAKLDLRNSLTEVLRIINTFIGSYQMLPSPDKISQKAQSIYRKEIWGSFPVSEAHLARAKDFHQSLKDTTTIDPDRMTYIAGSNRRTLAGLEIIAPGEFRYFETLEGDGRVPFSLGRLDGVRTYYVDEGHGSLPKNDNVIMAVDELLQRGLTSVLTEHPVISRATLAEGTRWHRSIGEHQIGTDLERIAKRAERNELDPDEQRAAEETLMRAALGEDQPARKLTIVKEEKPQLGRPRTPLHIEVVKGDITKIAVPVVVVGQYKGVAPINAVGALDKALNYWISQANEHSMIGSELGQVFFIPVNKGEIAADAVLMAGMGEEGRFNHHDLRYLMLNVTYAISALKVGKFATLLIGSGAGNLEEDRAIRGMLFGICDALHRLPLEQRLEHVILIEKNQNRHQKIFETLNIIKNEDSATNLDIKVTQRELREEDTKDNNLDSQRPADLPVASFGPRITVERDGDRFRFSALTRKAVIPVREVEIQSFFPDGIADRLMASTNKDEQEIFGQLLNTSLIPEDFQLLFDTNEPVTLVLDRTTASLPWEMACFARPEGHAFFGTHLSLTRQFRTRLSSTPGIAPQLNDSLRVLVIADPAPEPELQLPGARMEGRAVVKVLSQIKQDWNLDIDVVDRIGDAECDPIEILGLMLHGNFDIVHYAGHGVFDEKNPSHGGWVFGEGRFLSAREVFRARRVPRIIFANACFSAVVNRGKALTAEEMNRHLAGIAEAFFERGVHNYIGAGWPVQDDLAVRFATAFYENALTGQTLDIFQSEENFNRVKNLTANNSAINPRTLGESISEARKLILHHGSTWGAYHHYGQVDDLLMSRKQNARTSASNIDSTSHNGGKAKRKASRKQGQQPATKGKGGKKG